MSKKERMLTEINKNMGTAISVSPVTGCWILLNQRYEAYIRLYLKERLNADMSRKKKCPKLATCIHPLHQKNASETEWDQYRTHAMRMSEGVRW